MAFYSENYHRVTTFHHAIHHNFTTKTIHFHSLFFQNTGNGLI
jgi:hypothetical protein